MKIKKPLGAAKFLIALISLSLAVIDVSCKKNSIDTSLYEESKAPGLSYYKLKDTIYSPAAASPHGNFKLKFNAAAASQLNPDGKLLTGRSFSDGSLIVKEVYSGNTLTLYAVMKKDSKSKFSAKGWLWAEYEPGGNVHYNTSKKGESCISCHSSSTNRDYVRSFDLH